MIEIEMKLFGAFRKYHQKQSPIIFKLEAPASIDQIKIALSRELMEISREFGKNGEQLIKDSAIADDEQVLVPGTIVNQSCRLSILPPVCGG